MPSIQLDLNTINWDQLLTAQSGSGTFIGSRYQRGGGQRGKGLGGVLSSLFKLIPVFLNSAVGQEIVNTGKAVVTDVSEGKSLKSAMKHHGRKSVKNLTGFGRRKTIKRPIAVIVPEKRRLLLRNNVKTARRQIPQNPLA